MVPLSQQVLRSSARRQFLHSRGAGSCVRAVPVPAAARRRFLRPRGAPRGAASPPPLVDVIVRQLRALHATLTRQHTYSSSLYSSCTTAPTGVPSRRQGAPAGGGWERGWERGEEASTSTDFAHTTHPGLRGDRTQRSRGDRPRILLFGLENRIQTLVDVQQVGGDE